MRQLTTEERSTIRGFASKLIDVKRLQLLDDLENATVCMVSGDGAITEFEIAGYTRPEYCGQHPFGAEGRMLDADDAELSVLLHADGNDRLLELEIIRWDSGDLMGPRWNTLRLP
jgi:hypothetical protein